LDSDAVKLLNETIEKTGAKIVVSSSWRLHNSVKEITEYLVSKGFIGEIIDRTPRFSGKSRGTEIQAWLEDNEVDNFVILDDDSDMDHLTPKLVHTSWLTGLQTKHVDMCISKLGNTNEINGLA